MMIPFVSTFTVTFVCCFSYTKSFHLYTAFRAQRHREGFGSSRLSVTRTPPLDQHAWVKASVTPSFDDFDYLDYWYPVAFARDLPLDQVTKVTVFDEDYVVARLSNSGKKRNGNKKKESKSFKAYDGDEVIALIDRCPHKLAALSEGRITSCGSVQCAYHGWTFDGGSGKCLEVPQALAEDVSYDDRGGNNNFISKSKKGHATPIPAMIVQGMIWIFPGGMERALLSPEPPRIPEIDMDGFKVNPAVRDFPVDWTLLIENIMDPDHGLFAHTMPAFDLYSASATKVQTIMEEIRNDGKGWRVTSSVDAVDKLMAINKRWKKEIKTKDKNFDERKKGYTKVQPATVKRSTTTFVAPNLIYMGRRDPSTGETSFLTAFWICPVGVGRSRFLSASVGKLPFNIPRWILHINLNNFLDQDTFLVYSQQKHVLSQEAEINKIEEDGSRLRKHMFVYRSPTEKLQSRIASFYDATLRRAPNRAKILSSRPLNFGKPREYVLDRFVQHTKICPDSISALKNCVRIKKLSILVWCLTLLSHLSFQQSTGLFSSFILKRKLPKIFFFLSPFVTLVTHKLEKEFYFKYSEEFWKRDVQKIPTVWLDT